MAIRASSPSNSSVSSRSNSPVQADVEANLPSVEKIRALLKGSNTPQNILYSTSLLDLSELLKKKTTEGSLIKQLFIRTGLQEKIDKIAEKTPLLKRIQSASGISRDALKDVSLNRISELSSFKDISLSCPSLLLDEEFLEIRVQELNPAFSNWRISIDSAYFAARLDAISMQRPDLLHTSNNESPLPAVEELCIRHLRSLSAEQIYVMADKLSSQALDLFTEEQRRGLDLSKLPARQAGWICGFGNREAILDRFRAFSSENRLIAANTVAASMLSKFPTEFLELVPLSEMDSNYIDFILDTEERVQSLSPGKIKACLPKLSPKVLSQLSRVQIERLDHEDLTTEQVQEIYLHWEFTPEQRARRAQFAPPGFLAKMFPQDPD